MLHINDLTLRIGGNLLLEGARLHLPPQQRVGLVGRNGAGKTSLLRLIEGTLSPDAGNLRLRAGTRIGVVAQEAPGGETTPLQSVLAADVERATLLDEAEWAVEPARIAEIQTRLVDIDAHSAPARAAIILKGLGFDESGQSRPLSSYSGGWRMRVALAAVLFLEPDLLLLDEPTNHLDLEATMWLEAHLKAYRRTLLLVSHDRDLLDAVPQRIVHLDACKLTSYVGGYSNFVRKRNEQIVLQEKMRTKQEARRKHIQSYIDRFRYQANKARQAQSRIKALGRMQPIAAAAALEQNINLSFPATIIPAPPLITLDKVAVGYDGSPVLDRLDLRIDPDDRIALLGANGNGKSTFAKLIAGRLEPITGELCRSNKLNVGYFAQHQIEDLDPAQSAIVHLARRLPQEREQRLRTILGGFGLGQDKAERPAGQLSGGEKARLTFALMSAMSPQILILDEPTNHLDIDSREALIEAINEFAGAVIIISHDRHLLELTADQLWLVADGRVRSFDGDLDSYRRGLLSNGKASKAADAIESGSGGARHKTRRKSADRRAEMVPLRRAARDAERALDELNRERERLRADIADPDTYNQRSDKLPDLMRRGDRLDAQIADAEVRWLTAQEAMETAQNG